MDPFARLCGTCFTTAGKIQNIFGSNSEMIEIKDTLMICIPEVDFDEKCPLYLCEICQLILKNFQKFRLMCIKNMTILKSYMSGNDIHMHINRIIQEEQNYGANNSISILKKSLIMSEQDKYIEDEDTVSVKEETLEEILDIGDKETRIVFETLCKNENGEYDAVTMKEENLTAQDLGFCEMSTEHDNISDTTLNRIEIASADELMNSVTQNEITGQENAINIDLTISDDEDITTSNNNNSNLNKTRTFLQNTEESLAEQRLMRYNSANNDITSTVVKMTDSTLVKSLNIDKQKILLLVSKVQNNGTCRILLERLPVQDTVQIKDEEDDDDCEIIGEHRNIASEIKMNSSNGDAIITGRSIDNQVSCGICKETFATLGELQKHKLTHKKMYECVKCNKQYRHLITYNVHKMGHIRKIIKHEMRKRAQKQQQQHRNKPKKRVARQDVINPVESVILKENEKVVLAAKKDIGTVVEINDKMFDHQYSKKPLAAAAAVSTKVSLSCEVCKKSFVQQYYYDRHHQIYKYNCNKCDKHFCQIRMLESHQSRNCNDTLPYVCSKCDKPFAQRNHLRLHERVHFGFRVYKCNWCDVVMTRGRDIERHIDLQHIEADKRTSYTYEATKPDCYYCDICNKSFKNVQNLRSHELLHAKRAISKIPYECKYCNKSYIRMYNFNKHKCPKLPADQINTNVITPATTTSSNKNDSAYCTICKRQFATIYIYKTHARTHDNADPTPTYSCNVCSKKFGEKASLKQHKRSHIKLSCECDICGVECNTMTKLKKHKTALNHFVHQK